MKNDNSDIPQTGALKEFTELFQRQGQRLSMKSEDEEVAQMLRAFQASVDRH